MLTEFYVMVALRSFAIAMIQIFIPIFIFSRRNSFSDLLVFLFFTFIAVFLFSPVAAKMLSKFGNAHTMLFSVPFLVSFFLILYFADVLFIGLPIIGIIYGFSEAFFWMAFHDEFSTLSKTKKVGHEVGIYRSVTIISQVFGPILGALVIIFFGFNILFLIIIIFLLAGLIPLLFSKDIKPKQHFNIKNSFRFIHKKFPLRLPFIGYGAMTLSTAWLWPLMVFLLVEAYFELGAFATVINVITVFGVLIIGFKADTISKVKLVKSGAILFSATLILRSFVRTSFQAFGMWILGALMWPLIDVPFEALAYAKSKHLNKLEFFVEREHALFIGRMVILGVAAFFVSTPMFALSAAIFVSGLFTTLYWRA
jgi:MFS family permease